MVLCLEPHCLLICNSLTKFTVIILLLKHCSQIWAFASNQSLLHSRRSATIVSMFALSLYLSHLLPELKLLRVLPILLIPSSLAIAIRIGLLWFCILSSFNSEGFYIFYTIFHFLTCPSYPCLFLFVSLLCLLRAHLFCLKTPQNFLSAFASSAVCVQLSHP